MPTATTKTPQADELHLVGDVRPLELEGEHGRRTATASRMADASRAPRRRSRKSNALTVKTASAKAQRQEERLDELLEQHLADVGGVDEEHRVGSEQQGIAAASATGSSRRSGT